jgi:hypothetical protein
MPGILQTSLKPSARFTALYLALLVLSGVLIPRPASAQGGQAIPYYPGSQVDIEISIDRDDVLPLAANWLTGLNTRLDFSCPDLQNKLSGVLSRVQSAHILQVSLQGPVDVSQIVGFYARIPNGKSMDRIVRRYEKDGRVTLIWAGKDSNGLFVFRLLPARQEESLPLRAQIFSLQGYIDPALVVAIQPVRELLTKNLGFSEQELAFEKKQSDVK